MIKYCLVYGIVFFSWSVLSFSTVYKFDVLNFGTSAKSISVGRVEGFSYTASNVFENPAGLYRLNSPNFSEFLSSSLDNQVKFTSICAAYPFSNSSVGFGYMSARVSNLIHTSLDDSNLIIADSTFDFSDSVYKLSYAFSYSSSLDVGVSLSMYKFLMGPFYSAKGYNFDLSFMYYASDTFISSLSFFNVGRNMSLFSDGIENMRLPLKIHFSNKYRILNNNLYFKLQYRSDSPKLETGIGLDFTVPYLSFLVFNAGFSQTCPSDRYKNHLNLGFDFSAFPLTISFAYEKNDYYLSPNQYYFSFDFIL